MDFKKLFRKDDKAVSPVIGVILMVAITVILAAAIGSSVFNQNPTQTASKASINVKAVTIGDTDTVASITVEHLAGDSLDFGSSKAKMTATIEGGSSVVIVTNGASDTTNALGVLNAGDVKKVELVKAPETGTTPVAIDDIDNIKGKTVNIKITDTATNQVVCDRDVRFEVATT